MNIMKTHIIRVMCRGHANSAHSNFSTCVVDASTLPYFMSLYCFTAPILVQPLLYLKILLFVYILQVRGFEGRIHITRFSGKHLYLLNHLTSHSEH